MATEVKSKNPDWYVGGDGRDVLQYDERLDRGQLIATVASYVRSEGHTSVDAGTARLISTAPEGLNLAQMIVNLATEEELSTHVEVSFDPTDANLILHTARKLIAKASPA